MQGRYQGQADLPLSKVGRRQAARLASRLAQEEIHAIYASDLQRARETAAAVASLHNLPVRDDPRLREMDFGEWEGLTYEEIQERDPQQLAAWEAGPLDVAPPGGETLAQVAARVQAVLDEITAAHPDQTVLLVGHGGPLRVLLCLALGLSPQVHWQFGLNVASVSQVCLYDGDAVLTQLNDTGHLSPPHSPTQAGGRLILILGGARSGKSAFAQQMAQELGGERVLFVATAEAGDEEMRQRIEQHRRERPEGWRTLEAQRDVGCAILEQAGDAEAILVDCVTMLVSNLLVEAGDPFVAEIETRVMSEVETLAACAEQLSGHFIVISNEVGMGLVPPYPLGRAYRDLLGKVNQVLARAADEVYLLIAGVPMPIKGGGSTDGC
jgi:adenosylcobinamide kinase/adenosylcobinamide-phosphate guanylyltransferase